MLRGWAVPLRERGQARRWQGRPCTHLTGNDRHDYIHPKGTRPHFDGHSGGRSARRIKRCQSGGTMYAILGLGGFQTPRHSCGVCGALFHLHHARTGGNDRYGARPDEKLQTRCARKQPTLDAVVCSDRRRSSGGHLGLRRLWGPPLIWRCRSRFQRRQVAVGHRVRPRQKPGARLARLHPPRASDAEILGRTYVTNSPSQRALCDAQRQRQAAGRLSPRFSR